VVRRKKQIRMVILGIDPGLASTGYGAIKCSRISPTLLRCGSVRTSPGDHISLRLFQIYNDLNLLMETLRPEVVAVENAFSLVRYPRAGILLGGVIAMLYLNVVQHGSKVVEIAPKEVKSSLTGYGSATKTQIRDAASRALRVDTIKSFHAADALAVALTAFYRNYRMGNDIISRGNTKKGLC
jgi:crossover junction endodeoxyribonuclease RuvC